MPVPHHSTFRWILHGNTHRMMAVGFCWPVFQSSFLFRGHHQLEQSVAHLSSPPMSPGSEERHQTNTVTAKHWQVDWKSAFFPSGLPDNLATRISPSITHDITTHSLINHFRTKTDAYPAKILLLQHNQHFYLLTFRSLSETFIRRSLFNSSSGSCHDSDATSKGKNVGRVEVTAFL